MAYVLPQALIFQEFSIVPTALTAPLRACIIGPHYALNRYSDADEKPNIDVTSSYNPDADESFLWPNRAAGSSVDTGYTRVFFDDALLQYYTDPGGDASEIRVVDGYTNRVRFDALVLQTANGVDRSAAFQERDVAVGDVIDFLASACGAPVSHRSQILSLVPDVVAAVVDASASDPSNKSSLTEDVSYEQTAGDDNLVCIQSAVGSAYDGRADGQLQETYSIEVIQGGLLKITALSGTEGPITISQPSFDPPAPIAVGNRGLTVTFNNTGCGSSSSVGPGIDTDEFIIGQIWTVAVQQDYDAPDTESGGAYFGATDTTYLVEVTKGGDFGTAEISVSTDTGVDVGSPVVVPALNTFVAVGSQGVTIKFTVGDDGLCLGERYTIPVEAAGVGAVKTVTLATPLPDEYFGHCNHGDESSSSSEAPTDLSATFYIQDDIEVTEDRTGSAPLVNWEQSETEITLKTGIMAFDPTWTVGGVVTALPVKDGIVYVQHRDLLIDWCSTVGTVSDVSDLTADNFGAGSEIDPDNPLVFGIYNALLNSNGTDVKFIGVCASSPIELEDWIAALDVLKGRDDVYSLVPLTYDKQVQDAVVAHVEAMSAPDVGRWRITWLNYQAVTEKVSYSESEKIGNLGGIVKATITDDPDTSGTQYTLLRAEGEHFLTSVDQSPLAGDIVRIQYQDDGFGNTTYSEYVIDAILNDEEIRLSTGPSAAINTPIKMEIWRTLNRTQTANELATVPGLWDTRRAYVVWPDEVGNAGVTSPGYFLCCSLAGLRSASLPHRPLTNVEIIGWDDLTRTTEYFTETHLNTMADSGWWIVTQDPNDGDIYSRHQLSSDNLDLNRREQSVTTNIDSISYTFLERLAVYIGRGNVTPIMINIIRGEIYSVMDFFSNFVVQDILGPQVVSYEIRQLEQHPLLRDRILAIVDVVVPYPLNNIELHLVV